MDGFDQFTDLPQIPSANGSSGTRWPTGYLGHISMSTLDAVRTFSLHGEDLNFDVLKSHKQLSMQPMQRFLHGSDCPPFAAGFLQATQGYNMNQYNHHGQYDQPWPAVDYMAYSPRNGSPDRTSISGNSSHGLQNELLSPHPMHEHLCGSPNSSVSVYSSHGQDSQSLLYPGAAPLTGGYHTSELLTGTQGINLRDVEYNPGEPEMHSEDQNYGEMKPEYDHDTEAVYTRVDSVSEPFQPYTDDGTRHRDPESVQPVDRAADDSSDSDYKPSSPKANKKRRSSASSGGSGRQTSRRQSNGRKTSTAYAFCPPNRVNKKTRSSNATTIVPKGAASTADEGDQRPFPCPLASYGCQSNFSSKNEWKRHVYTQHIKLGFWRCDLCATTVDRADDRTIYHNDFNRKDLFCQHLRRMHAAPRQPYSSSKSQKREYPVNEENLADHTARCYQSLRTPPQQSSCLFCDHTFTGPNSWDNRMEHVGRHLEKDRKSGIVSSDPTQWRKDDALEQYLIAEGLITHERDGSWKIGDGRPRRLSDADADEADVDE